MFLYLLRLTFDSARRRTECTYSPMSAFQVRRDDGIDPSRCE